ncbi:MAG: FAD-binding oxidoreductase [Acidobacteria bacterium]|nr:FAD-binding oxidoreductase [Acidobacteriota bacterium]
MSRTRVDRRAFLKIAGAAAAVAALPGCAARRPFDVERPRARRRFVPVQVAPDRVIRTVAGLRPFRPSGFVVRAESAGDKLLVHDYGHGGGGVTLSWGTAQLSIDELAGWTGARDRCAVVGCGAVGLATARLLQRRGAAVTIYAKDPPPNTTSNVAGAQWGPFSVFDRGMTTAAFDDQFARAARLSWRLFQDLAGSDYGISWIENYSLSDSPFTDRPRRDLVVDVVVRDFGSADQVRALEEPIVFNCSGLGAKAIFGDEELTPIKGQLTFLLPQPEVDYITLPGGGLYMFPRSDGILLGGTHERGVWTLDPDLEAERRILEAHREFFARMR